MKHLKKYILCIYYNLYHYQTTQFKIFFIFPKQQKYYNFIILCSFIFYYFISEQWNAGKPISSGTPLDSTTLLWRQIQSIIMYYAAPRRPKSFNINWIKGELQFISSPPIFFLKREPNIKWWWTPKFSTDDRFFGKKKGGIKRIVSKLVNTKSAKRYQPRSRQSN